MSLESLRTEIGHRYPPSKVAEFFGVTPDTLRMMCARGEVDCKTTITEKGAVRYLISENAIRKWSRQSDI